MILKINYRNTKQILQTASTVAESLLRPRSQDEDGIPLVRPVSCGRDGAEPIVIDLPTMRQKADRIAELMASAHSEGHAWADMAVLCRTHWVMDEYASALYRRRLPHKVRRGTNDFDPSADTIKVMTLHASKGLEFPVVAVVGTRHLEAEDSANVLDSVEEIRLLYVGSTRATSRLIVANVG